MDISSIPGAKSQGDMFWLAFGCKDCDVGQWSRSLVATPGAGMKLVTVVRELRLCLAITLLALSISEMAYLHNLSFLRVDTFSIVQV